MKRLDIRSDTVTKPTEEMRMAMYRAEVGDDVCGDDPTVIKLESIAADMVGKEAAVFVPSGTFGNQLSIFTHCQRGNEVILDNNCHIVEHEAGAAAIIAGVQLRPVKCTDGILSPDDLESRIRKVKNIHFPETGLVCMENAHSSGRVINPEKMRYIYEISVKYNIPVHLDGARIFNAAVSLGVDVKEITGYCDSLMFCLSKGLGAPVGSILAGSADFIGNARYKRKIMGGGMRQAGVLAAPGIIALTKMVDRLEADHKNASKLAGLIREIPGVQIFEDTLDINIIFFTLAFDVDDNEFIEFFVKSGVSVYPPENGIFRFVMNYGIDEQDILHIYETLRNYVLTKAPDCI